MTETLYIRVINEVNVIKNLTAEEVRKQMFDDGYTENVDWYFIDKAVYELEVIKHDI